MDRCCGAIHCMEFWGKYGGFGGYFRGGDEKAIVDYMNHFLIISGAVPVAECGRAWPTCPKASFRRMFNRTPHTLGSRLVKAFRTGEVPLDVDLVRKKFRERMRGLVDYRKEEWPYEYAYWKEKLGE